MLPEKQGSFDRLYGSAILPSSIVEFYPDPTLVIDNRRRVVAWNKAMEKMTGIASDDIIDRGDYEYALPFYGERKPILVDLVGLSPEEISERYMDVVVDGDKVEAMTIKATLKGKQVVLWGTAARLYGLDGKPVGAIECIRDVTGLMRIEEKLRESEEKFRLITTSTNDGIVTMDGDGIITYVNPSGLSLLGLPAGEVTSRHFSQFVAAEYLEMTLRKHARGLSGEPVKPFEVEIVGGNGARIPVELCGSALEPLSGKSVIVSIRDMSESRKARQELKKAHDELELRVEERTAELTKARGMLQAVLDTIPAGIIAADATSNRITYKNQSAARIFGPHIADINVSSGHRPYVLQWPDGTPMKTADRPLNRSVRNGEYVHDEEMVICHPDGRRISVLMSSAPVIDEGRIIGGVASAIDITERKSSEQALKEAKDQAELYLDLLGHDINNMNQVAMGYVELAAGLLSDARALSLLGRSLTMLQDSSRLIDDLRKIQQATGGKMKLEPVDLDAILSQVTDEYSVVPGRAVTIDYIPGKGRVVRANQLLKDVFSNIVDNAIKHSTGDLRIAISARPVPRHFEVIIGDNGPGIPDDLKKTIFSRSWRGATKARGSGLGLYLVHSLVKASTAASASKTASPVIMKKGAGSSSPCPPPTKRTKTDKSTNDVSGTKRLKVLHCSNGISQKRFCELRIVRELRIV